MTVTYLLFSGTVTTSATVCYALLLLLKYPWVQGRSVVYQPGPGNRSEEAEGKKCSHSRDSLGQSSEERTSMVFGVTEEREELGGGRLPMAGEASAGAGSCRSVPW